MAPPPSLLNQGQMLGGQAANVYAQQQQALLNQSMAASQLSMGTGSVASSSAP